MPTTNNSDSVALSISSRLHNFTKSGASWIVTLSSSDFYKKKKNPTFSFILNCTVPSLMLFYNLMRSRVVSKSKICELLGHYRRGPNLQNSSDSLFITTLTIIETYPWAWECACIAHLYWNWYDEIGFVTLPLIQCIYVLKCRVIICLDNRFMNVRPQVPQHSPEQTQSFFLSYPLKLH